MSRTGRFQNLSTFFKSTLKILEVIGRFSYRLVFLLLSILLKGLLVVVPFFIRLVVQFLELIGSSIVFLTQKVTSLLNQVINQVLQFKPPQPQLPSLKLPKVKLPHFRLPKIKLKLPRLRFPKIRLPKIKPTQLKLPKIKKPRPKKPKKLFFKLFFAISVIFLSVNFYFWIFYDLPNPESLKTHQPILTTKIYDRNDQLLYKIYTDENRTIVNLNEIPQHFVNATLAAEDSEFYHHQGLSWKGILRSAEKIVVEDNLQGGSTITQQLIKNTLLSPERTLRRKVKEAVLSLMVEVKFSKDEILQMYFNEIPYGGTAYGAEEAAQAYFGKSIKTVNLAESALLAGLPAAPTHFSPFGAHPELARARQIWVIDRMVEEGFISPQEAQEAKNQKLVFVKQPNQLKAPHFVMYVKELLVEKYGQRRVEQGGLQVKTSLDLKLQNQVKQITVEELEKVAGFRISNGASLVTNPKTGEVLAMIGSKNFWDQENDGNVNVTLRPRQPGSSIKPINYAVALQNGYTAASVISDTPITYHNPGSPPYSPKNYDNRFHGNVTLRRALACSYNVPAVKVLNSYGVSKMLEQGQRMGITTWNDPSRYGLALTLGGAEVKMIDMAVAYGSLANYGKRVDLNPILEIKDAQGKIIESTTPTPQKQVVSPQVAFILSDILSDNQARTPAFGPRSYLYIPEHQVAVKTGTSNNLRDNWTIGYTTNHVVTVWVGNNDNTPMSRVASGVTGASPIWSRITKLLLQESQSHRFTPPEGVVQAQVCVINGLLPCRGCPTITEYFVNGTQPTRHCSSSQIEAMKKAQEDRDQLLEGTSTEGE